MKKIILYLVVLAIMAGFNTNAQNGIITTVAGNGVAGYSGDGGLATAAMLNYPNGVAIDAAGNIYIGDYFNNRIRKVSATGIISTIAGTGTTGYSGDGAAATAALLSYPTGFAFDRSGNLYFADDGNFCVRKINSAGIISTIAGNGASGSSGDGGAATSAQIGWVFCIVFDSIGNLYIPDFSNNNIRIVDTSGIINTFAGTGVAGYSGDGGAATAAQLYSPYGITIRNGGNIYFSDYNNNVIRKISPANIITTIAGTGTEGYSGDGGPASAAEFSLPEGIVFDNYGNLFIADIANVRVRKISVFGTITTVAGNGIRAYTGDGGMATIATLDSPGDLAFDPAGNLYLADFGNQAIRKLQFIPTASSDSFSVMVNNSCEGLNFEFTAKNYSAGQHIKTYFGNGEYLDTTTTLYSTIGISVFHKAYSSSGIYTIKHILFDGTMPVDSITYSYAVSLCQNLPVNFYYDALGTCVYNDSADFLIPLPLLVEVDSNSIPVDTISATGGLYYSAYGNPGDVYTFRVISYPVGTYATCPSSGSVSDTLFTGISSANYLGFGCMGSSSFDLAAFAGAIAGRHMQTLHFDVSNAYCTPKPATFTLAFSPQYDFTAAWPPPTTVSGNIVTWNLTGVSILNSNSNFNVSLHVPGAWLIPGDTVMTNCVITPVIGDTDTLNNVIVRTDTVTASYDPNEMAVTPKGCILSGVVTQLQYTILFENTGNDTAHNIYVMDTLSDNLDPHSLRIVSASNTMNVSKWYNSTWHNIYKFEFPHINLLDSSHHNKCDGMLIFNINTKPGLASGATIFNHAGIFFDDNPVVMTDTVENTVGCALTLRSTLPVLSPSIYPNPTTNELILKADNSAYTSFTITNIVGQPLVQQTINTNETRVNVALLPAGVYFVTFKGENGDVVRRFVKM